MRLTGKTLDYDVLDVFTATPFTGNPLAVVHGAEDAGTGSAALALGVWLVDRGVVPADEETGYRVSQGREIGRPSILDCVVVASGGRARWNRRTVLWPASAGLAN